MTNAYQEWQRERESELAALRGISSPQPQRASLESDVIVPVLQALAIALVGGLALGTGAVLIGFGQHGWARWAMAGQVAGGAFVFILAGAVVKLIVDHHASTRDPYIQAQKRIDAAKDKGSARPDPDAEPNYVIMRAPARPALAATLDHEIETVIPQTDPATEQLYRFIVDAWRADDVTQSGCMGRGWRRRDWDRMVGGSRRRADLGNESGRGLLDRAGLVRKDGGKWEIVASLDQALTITDDLASYAEARASVVKLDKTDQTSQDGTGAPSRGVLLERVGDYGA